VRYALNRLWTALFVAAAQLPVAGVVSGLVGAENGLTFWFMGIAAHLQVRSATNLSLPRRIANWLAAMTAGGIAAWFGAIATSLLMQTTSGSALSDSGQATNVFWFLVAIRLAIRWAPVAVVWVVGGILVRREARRRHLSPLTPATR
jgi:hypothetical protein